MSEVPLYRWYHYRRPMPKLVLGFGFTSFITGNQSTEASARGLETNAYQFRELAGFGFRD